MPEEYPRFYLYKRIVQAKLFIDAHYEQAMELDNIADEACFSKFHFLRLFKAIYGKTPHQYLIMVRVERAAALLQQGKTVAEACYGVGFESLSSFSGLFRRRTGFPPAAYQRRYQVRQEQIRTVPLQFIPNCFAEQKGWAKNSNFQEI